MDLELSRAYTRLAMENPALSSEEETQLLQAALEFDPDNGDARVMLTRLRIENEGPKDYQSYRLELERALGSGGFELLETDTVRTELSELYERLMEYPLLKALLDQITPGKRDGHWFRMQSVALYRLGREEEARLVAQRGGRFFPESRELKQWRIRIDPLYRGFLLNTIDNPLEPPPEEEILSALIEATPQDEQRLKLLELFRSRNYDAPAVRLLLYRYDEEGEDPPFPELLGTRRLIGAAHDYYTETGQLEEWEEFLLTQVVEFPGDFNRDGFPERFYRLVRGELREYREDLDQDGIEERRLLLAGERGEQESPLPIELSLSVEAETVTIRYALYPQVAELEIIGSSETIRYLFAPDSYALPLVEVHRLPPEVELPRFFSIDSEALSVASYSRQVTEPERTIVAGPNRSRAEIEGRMVVEAYREGGTELIERDLDGNGVNEIREEYSQGRLELLLLDQDENGIFEYRYDMIDDMEMWDFDQDGSVDYRRRRTQD